MKTQPKNQTKTSEILFGTGVNESNGARLAAAVGVSRGTITNWKRDPSKIPLEKMVIIIRVRNIQPEEALKVLGFK